METITPERQLESDIYILEEGGVFPTPWDFKLRLSEALGLSIIDPVDVFDANYKLEVYDANGITGKIFIGEEARDFKLFVQSLSAVWEELKTIKALGEYEPTLAKFNELRRIPAHKNALRTYSEEDFEYLDWLRSEFYSRYSAGEE